MIQTELEPQLDFTQQLLFFALCRHPTPPDFLDYEPEQALCEDSTEEIVERMGV